MEEYKERLKTEQSEVRERYLRLVDKINSEDFYTFSERDKKLLTAQKVSMEMYLNILNLRLYGKDTDDYTIDVLPVLMSALFSPPKMPTLPPVSKMPDLGDKTILTA